MVKRVIFGDIHGHISSLKELYLKESPDEVIILGDYVDSSTIDSNKCRDCLEQVLELKQTHEKEHGKNSFILLLGNHELHYILPGERYSGFKYETQYLIYDLLKKAIMDHDIQIIFVDDINKTVYSHAGITKQWYDKYKFSSLENINNINNISDLDKFKFTGWNRYGNDPNNGPLWVRPSSLIDNLFDENWKQIIGHTHTKEPLVYDKVLVIDTMPNNYIIQELNNNREVISQIIT